MKNLTEHDNFNMDEHTVIYKKKFETKSGWFQVRIYADNKYSVFFSCIPFFKQEFPSADKIYDPTVRDEVKKAIEKSKDI